MIRAVRLQNAVGFTYKEDLAYGNVIQGGYPVDCKADKGLSWPLYLAKGAIADYKEQSCGFDGCPVTWGPTIGNTSHAQMNVAATEAGAEGFTYQDSLKYGAVMIGKYPEGCKSGKGLSWPLYLK